MFIMTEAFEVCSQFGREWEVVGLAQETCMCKVKGHDERIDALMCRPMALEELINESIDC